MPARKVVLYEHQIEHNKRCKEILMRPDGYILIDTSYQGGGKSYNAAALAQYFNVPVGVISTITVISKWQNEIVGKYDLKCNFLLGYESLRSMKGNQPKHGLLVRHDTINEAGAAVLSFEPTEKLREMIRNGMLLIIDEFQHIKNISAQYLACRTVVKTILAMGGRSRVLMLSGSPFDKHEHTINFMRLANFIGERAPLSILDKLHGSTTLIGAKDLMKACARLNPELTDHVYRTCPHDHANVTQFCYRLFVEVIRPTICSSMPCVSSATLDAKNGFYNLTQGNMRKVISIIDDLGDVVKYDAVKKTIEKKSNFTTVNAALMNTETAKNDELTERLIRETLKMEVTMPDGKPGYPKVVIMLNYIDNLLELMRKVSDLNPLLLYGSTPQARRPEIIDQFQESNNKYRVLICNPLVCAEGIDLDDKEGHFPRYVWISPNYRIGVIFQSASRFSRANTVSKATVRILYAKGCVRELAILDALARKTTVLSETLPDSVGKLKFPGNYEDEIEPDIPIENFNHLFNEEAEDTENTVQEKEDDIEEKEEEKEYIEEGKADYDEEEDS